MPCLTAVAEAGYVNGCETKTNREWWTCRESNPEAALGCKAFAARHPTTPNKQPALCGLIL